MKTSSLILALGLLSLGFPLHAAPAKVKMHLVVNLRDTVPVEYESGRSFSCKKDWSKEKQVIIDRELPWQPGDRGAYSARYNETFRTPEGKEVHIAVDFTKNYMRKFNYLHIMISHGPHTETKYPISAGDHITMFAWGKSDEYIWDQQHAVGVLDSTLCGGSAHVVLYAGKSKVPKPF